MPILRQAKAEYKKLTVTAFAVASVSGEKGITAFAKALFQRRCSLYEKVYTISGLKAGGSGRRARMVRQRGVTWPFVFLSAAYDALTCPRNYVRIRAESACAAGFCAHAIVDLPMTIFGFGRNPLSHASAC